MADDVTATESTTWADFPRKWSGPAVIAVVFVALAAWSWRKWGDPVIDFGLQIYMPSRLAKGDVLYRDIAWKNGMTSAYFHAALFRIFGDSTRTLIFANLALTALFVAGIYAFFLKVCDRLTATAVCLVFLSIFCFSQYTLNGTYNYIFPYIYEQTHGTMAATAAVVLTGLAVRRPTRGAALAIGFCLGVTFLLRAEIFVAALAASGTGLAWGVIARPARRAEFLRAGAFALGAGILPVLIGFGILAIRLPPATAWRGVLGNWSVLFSGGLQGNQWYLELSGLADLGLNLRLMGTAFLVGGGVVASLAAIAFLFRGQIAGRLVVCVVVGGTLFILGVKGVDFLLWQEIARALPLAVIGAGAWMAFEIWRGRKEVRVDALEVPLLIWSVFAFGMLGKIMLKAWLSFYGFTLALPATLLVVALCVGVLPRRLAGIGIQGDVLRAGVCGILLAVVAAHFQKSNFIYSFKTEWLDHEILVFDPRQEPTGETVANVTRDLRGRMTPSETLLVLPEGVFINWLTGKRNPTPYNAFIPLDLATYGGEAKTLAVIQANPPDYIVFLDRDMSEFGFRSFGAPECGKLMMDWIKQTYQPVASYGEVSRAPIIVPAVILRRKSPEMPGQNPASQPK